MKKNIILTSIAAASLLVSSCGPMTGTTGAGTTAGTGATSNDALSTILGSVTGSDVANAGSNILNSLLGSILSTTLTEQSIIGTWTYVQPEVRFESENLLAKAGGEVAAATIEQKMSTYLSKVGITKGVTTYTFNQDKTFTITTGGKTVASGTYTFTPKSNTLKMQGTLGLMNQTCTVGMDGTNLCLLYEADKLLSVANSVGSTLGKLSGNSTLSTVTSLLGSNYKGMKLGFQLSK